jgi:hypothetical protein
MKNRFILWCGLGLLALLPLGIAARAVEPPRVAAAPFRTQSQGLQVLLNNLTPAARELALNSLRSLTPAALQQVEKEYDALGELNVFTAQMGLGDARAAAAMTLSDIVRYLPDVRSQQRFMNGTFGAGGFEDKRFADQVTRQYAEIVQRQSDLSQYMLEEQMRRLRQMNRW